MKQVSVKVSPLPLFPSCLCLPSSSPSLPSCSRRPLPSSSPSVPVVSLSTCSRRPLPSLSPSCLLLPLFLFPSIVYSLCSRRRFTPYVPFAVGYSFCSRRRRLFIPSPVPVSSEIVSKVPDYSHGHSDVAGDDRAMAKRRKSTGDEGNDSDEDTKRSKMHSCSLRQFPTPVAVVEEEAVDEDKKIPKESCLTVTWNQSMPYPTRSLEYSMVEKFEVCSSPV
ncbi:hypothetical protein ACFE04_014351 [Oxalis oulophora]